MRTREWKIEGGRWQWRFLVRGLWSVVRPIGFCFLLSAFSFQFSAFSQSYVIDWSTIDGGGGTSTGGVYAVSGTIGQPDAGVMSGGNYTLHGGFWGIIAAVQTPGAPWLSLACSNGVVLVSWPKSADGWVLEYRTDLTSGTWMPVSPPYPTNTTDCYISEPSPSGNKFYRLHKP